MIDIVVPPVGESITEVTLTTWMKPDGAWVDRDEIIAELESEKATFELRAEQAGTLKQVAEEGQDLEVGDLAAQIDETAERPEGQEEAAAPSEPTPKKETAPAPSPKPEIDAKATPVAKAMMADQNVSPDSIKGSGPHGKILKSDVSEMLQNPGRKPGTVAYSREEKVEKMSKLRRTISRRLVEAKNTTAMLTTFNEVDMTAIKNIRTQYKETFKEKHGVGLGFMSFFTKACTYALQEYPAVNSYIDDENLIYHDFCDISIAVSTPKGLVVPVIRNAESLSMQGIEKAVVELATKARDGKLTIDEMTGGTFTITNGGVFGSLLSTPIINIPQSAILGMHKIEDRPIAVNGQVVIKPMMYVALSYDHRVIDGKESVGFLVRVKELLENPEKMLFGDDPMKALLEIN